MKLEVKDKNTVCKDINLIIKYLKEYDDYFSYEEKLKIKEALCDFSMGYDLYNYLCLQICDELNLLPDDQNPYKAFTETLNEQFNIENKNVVEIGGGKLLRLGKRIINMQDMGTVTVYDSNTLIRGGQYPRLRIVRRKFKSEMDAYGADVLVGLLAYTSASVAIDVAIAENKDFMFALFNKQNNNLFCEGSDDDINEINSFVERAEKDLDNSNLGKLKVKYMHEIGDNYPIIYNNRG